MHQPNRNQNAVLSQTDSAIELTLINLRDETPALQMKSETPTMKINVN
jgi:hypothetical protein